jgi:hypothetical protein
MIVAVGMNSQISFIEPLEPMTTPIAANNGAVPMVMTTDVGYWSEDSAQHC